MIYTGIKFLEYIISVNGNCNMPGEVCNECILRKQCGYRFQTDLVKIANDLLITEKFKLL
jgi:hypothetical protein